MGGGWDFYWFQTFRGWDGETDPFASRCELLVEHVATNSRTTLNIQQSLLAVSWWKQLLWINQNCLSCVSWICCSSGPKMTAAGGSPPLRELGAQKAGNTWARCETLTPVDASTCHPTAGINGNVLRQPKVGASYNHTAGPPHSADLPSDVDKFQARTYWLYCPPTAAKRASQLSCLDLNGQ